MSPMFWLLLAFLLVLVFLFLSVFLYFNLGFGFSDLNTSSSLNFGVLF